MVDRRTGVLLILSCLFALNGCEEPSQPAVEPLVRPTKLFEVRGEPAYEMVELPAVVEAGNSTVMTFQVPGLIQRLLVDEGVEIEAGDVVAQLDLRELENAVATAEAEFTRAKGEYERARELLAGNTIAKSTVDNRQAAFRTAQAALANAKKRLEDGTLRAPFNAIVVELHVEQFQTVAPQQAVVTLQSDGLTEAVVQVPASIVIKPENAEPLSVYFELDAALGRPIAAQLSEVVAQADPATQTFEARFRFEPPTDLLILPGMTGSLIAQLPADQGREAETPRVPVAAVQSKSGDTYVWLVDTEGMTVSKRSIVVGLPRGETIAVIEGLSAGETVVAAGGNYLYEGAKIRAY